MSTTPSRNPLHPLPSWGLSDGEGAAWEWTQERAHARGREWDGGPLGPLGNVERKRRIAVGRLALDSTADPLSPDLAGLHLASERGIEYIQHDRSVESARRLLLALEHAAGPGGFVAFWQGASLEFHVVLRRLAPHALTLGYSVQPIGVGAELRCLILTREGRSTWLTDVRAMSGCRDTDLQGWLGAFGQDAAGQGTQEERLARSLDSFQGLTRTLLGVSPRATVGGTAVAAFRRTLPADPLWLRPSPGLVALCRAGMAYRGGWVYGTAYQGPAWKVDCNKLYLWSLAQGVPTRHKLGRCIGPSGERPGIYLARIDGRLPLPVAIPAWSPRLPGFRREAWWGGPRLTCLPQAEFAGLRALGATVAPLVGYVQTARCDTSGFAELLCRIHRSYPRGSPQHLAAKFIGNSLVGKLGENPWRLDLLYQQGWPGHDWWPYLTWDDRLVPDLWVRRRWQASAHQRVDAAAYITARARSRVYGWAAEQLEGGTRIVHIDTDGFILASPPSGWDSLDGATPGAFRLEAYDPRATVLGPKSYLLDGEAHASGFADLSPAAPEVAFERGSVTVAQSRLRAPWESDRIVQLGSKVLRRQG